MLSISGAPVGQQEIAFIRKKALPRTPGWYDSIVYEVSHYSFISKQAFGLILKHQFNGKQNAEK
jgi:hypothetical protein